MQVDVAGPSVPGLTRHELREFVDRCYDTLGELGATGSVRHTELTVSFVSDTRMRRLNSDWRGKTGTTDILTFPSDVVSPDGSFRPLGDLVISLPQARKQARTESHPLGNEVLYLVLHGMIHALGYDHETDDGEMNALELEARKQVGL